MPVAACALCLAPLARGASDHPRALPFKPLAVEGRTHDAQPAEFGAFPPGYTDQNTLDMIDIGILRGIAGQAFLTPAIDRNVLARVVDGVAPSAITT